MTFAHLHLHTTFSVLDGLSEVEEVAAKAAADGQPGVAITDHGTLAGHVKMVRAAEKHGVKPILGAELYVAIGKMEDRDVADHAAVDKADRHPVRRYDHLTVLAATPQGWSNLCRISSTSWTRGFWHRPRTDLDHLTAQGRGLIVLTGCVGGRLARHLLRGETGEADLYLDRLKQSVDAVYVEVMSHGIEEEKVLIPELKRIATRHGLKLVATNDSHYTDPEDAEVHEAWLCVSSRTTLQDPNRWTFPGEGYHMHTAAEMRRLFSRIGLEEACDTTLEVCDRVDRSVLPPSLLRLPTIPGVRDPDRELRAKVEAGARRRWPEMTDQVKARLDRELEIIARLGFSSYFLIEASCREFAQQNGILCGPGRGSAAGSAVAYALGITAVDPLRHDLLFERFLNPDRRTMPDIDADYESARRDEVIEHLKRIFGADHVLRVGTFTTLQGKAALRDAARVTGLSTGMADRMSAAYPQPRHGNPMPLSRALDEEEVEGAELRKVVGLNETTRRAARFAARFERKIRAEGVHPCAVVVSPEPLTGLVPVRVDKAGQTVSQFEAEDIEWMGFLKFDRLGLSTLDEVAACLRSIKEVEGVEVRVEDMDPYGPADDVWDLLSKGDTSGVFQLEGDGMRAFARRLKPRSLDDLSHLLALYRPGPMEAGLHVVFADRKNGREKVSYRAVARTAEQESTLHSVLGTTYGVLVYQEQSMLLAQRVAGFEPGEADQLRKAIGKKLASEMAALHRRFVEGATVNGWDEKAAETMWGWIKGSAGYAFNRSHAVAYAMISFWTAWLKARYPDHMLATRLARTRDPEKRAALLSEAAGKVAVPDVNRSGVDASVVDGMILLGLCDVEGLAKTAEVIVEERRRNGPFLSVEDLVARVPQINKGTLRRLAQAGALTRFGSRRSVYEGVDGLEEWDDLELADHEFQALSLHVTVSPLKLLAKQISSIPLPGGLRPLPIRVLVSDRPTGKVATAGVAVQAKKRVSRKGGQWGTFSLRGSTHTLPCIVWGDRVGEMEVLAEGAPVVVVGRIVERDDEEPRFVVDSIHPVPRPAGRVPVYRLSDRDLPFTEEVLKKVRKALRAFPAYSLQEEGRVVARFVRD